VSNSTGLHEQITKNPIVIAALAASVVVSIGVGAAVHHHAKVRDANAAAAVQLAMRASIAEHPSPSRETNAVEVGVAASQPELTFEPVTESPAKVATAQEKKARRRTSLWSSIKGFFSSKHA
jgi:hypothetical protein